MRVTVVNVNGTLDVHAEGCADLKRRPKYRRYLSDGWTIDADTEKEIVEDVYGPAAGSFYEESDLPEGDPNNWRHFRQEFVIFPCVKGLPED